MFEVRGYMLDISRDRVPTMKTLREIVDLLARCRYNQFQLYTEHTFAYSAHRTVWEDADPMTAAEIRKLDAYCQMQGVELVPNQNCFGHMERWLVHPEYNALAKFPKGGAMTPWGTIKKDPTTLDPKNPGSIALVDGLLEELLPNFSSSLVNVGCDETFEISDPGEYLEFLVKVCDAARKRGKRPMFWGDIVLRHPELIAKLPRDLVALDWGYEGNHPFQRECAEFRKSGLDFYVCPGTSSWRSLAGRVENMRENLEAAEKAGRENGAKGYLVADWGDEGHWQPLAASLPGIIMGGAFAASGAKAAKMDLELELNRVMDAPLGGLLLRLGTLYLRGGALRANCSELFNILVNGHGYSRHPGLTQPILDDISGVARGVAIAAERWADENVWAKEIVYMANLVDCACHRRDEGRLRALRDEHGRVWRLRSREGGRADSLAKLPRF
ncbi:MAG: beta-N-acetylhexosaminidase [Kiritimatiellae bacterium]|nr:beta-N-acetylhexosaminidase [Kiritimatiellia bacterium]